MDNVEIRVVQASDPKDHSIVTDRLAIPMDLLVGKSEADVSAIISRQVQAQVQGCTNELVSEGCGPARYAEVVCRGLCYVYDINVHGQTIEKTEVAHG